eukprot:8572105-Pyramimonas_sp.AAC.1
MPGHAVMPSTAVPGKFNEEVECDIRFYTQERTIFDITDRCVRYGAGVEMPDKLMTSMLDAHQHCCMQFGPAEVLYSDGV